MSGNWRSLSPPDGHGGRSSVVTAMPARASGVRGVRGGEVRGVGRPRARAVKAVAVGAAGHAVRGAGCRGPKFGRRHGRRQRAAAARHRSLPAAYPRRPPGYPPTVHPPSCGGLLTPPRRLGRGGEGGGGRCAVATPPPRSPPPDAAAPPRPCDRGGCGGGGRGGGSRARGVAPHRGSHAAAACGRGGWRPPPLVPSRPAPHPVPPPTS